MSVQILKRGIYAVSFMVMMQPATAQSGLSTEAEITEGLLAVGQALEISDKCSALSPRKIRGAFFLNGLRNRAIALGYSSAEVDAYVDNKAEQNRLEDVARARLAEKGVISGQEATYCAVGRAEIAARSQIGRLLY
jgi:hypothetical protein